MQFLSPLVVQLQALQQSPYHWLIVPIGILAFILFVRLFCSICIYLVSPFSGKYSVLVGLVFFISSGVLLLLVFNPTMLEQLLPNWRYSLGYGLISITGLFLTLALWKLFRTVIVAGFWATVCLVLIGAVFFNRMPQEWLSSHIANDLTEEGIKQFEAFIKSNHQSSVNLNTEGHLKVISYLPDLAKINQTPEDL